jgi:hypothetical protein
MSRRFREQPSSASGTRLTKPHSHLSPVPPSRSSRFIRPSSTQQVVSTPKPSVSRFRDEPKLKDEIETSFEEAEQISPQLPSRLRFSSSVSRQKGLINDLDDEEHKPSTGVAPRRVNRDLTENVEDDGLADLEFLERLRGTRTSQSVFGLDIDFSSSESELFTPNPSRKRRRLENRTDHDFSNLDIKHDNQLNLPSVNPPITGENDKELGNHLPDSNSDSASDLPSSPIVAPINRASTKPSRFKHPDPISSSHNLLNHQTNTPTTTTKRPSFRPLPIHNSASDSTHMNLPHSFSPSRRRGGGRGTSYLPGGAADMVRGWVVGLAGAASAGSEGRGMKGVEKVAVKEVLGRSGNGVGNRCALIRDEGERGWCLIGADAGGGSTHNNGALSRTGIDMGASRTESRTGNTVEKGSVIHVRMGWDLDLCSHRDAHLHEEEEEEEGKVEEANGKGCVADVWKVAVLWTMASAPA